MNLKLIMGSLLAASYQLPALAAAPSGVYIKKISATTEQAVLPILSVRTYREMPRPLPLLFSDYVAEVGPGVSRRESRKNCQVTVDLDFPMGWQYAVMSFDYRGFASLDRGIEAEQGVSYYFQGQGYTGRSRSRIRGEFDDDWQFRDRIGLDTYVWSPCGEKEP